MSDQILNEYCAKLTSKRVFVRVSTLVLEVALARTTSRHKVLFVVQSASYLLEERCLLRVLGRRVIVVRKHAHVVYLPAEPPLRNCYFFTLLSFNLQILFS